MGLALGLLSTAAINQAVLTGAAASDCVDVVAVASRDDARAEAYAREHGIERAFGSYDALLEDRDVDAVYISLPNSLHVEWSVRALEAGKHVLCEKPLGRRADDVARAFDAADRAGRILTEAFMWRHLPQTHRLVELIEEGVVGRLQHVRAAFSFPMADPAGDVRNSRELAGGAVMDIGCYCVSAARLLAGEPERVYGEQVLGESGVDHRFAATLRFPDEVLAQFDVGLVLPRREGLDVIGTEGSLFLGEPWKGREPVIELRHDGEVERLEVEAADPYRLELEDLEAAIRGEHGPLLGRDDALGQARTIEALYRSADEGRPVTP